MKYIRTYENIEPLINLKKYLVYEFPTSLIIVKVLYVEAIEYVVKRLFVATGPDNIKKETSLGATYRLTYSKDIKRIIYQSDDLQDVLNNIPMLFDVKKYNL